MAFEMFTIIFYCEIYFTYRYFFKKYMKMLVISDHFLLKYLQDDNAYILQAIQNVHN